MPIQQISQLEPNQVQQVADLFRHEWWTKARTPTDITRMLAHCDLIIAFEDADSHDLVAFARVLTDYVYKAFVFDVIVRADQRGLGLGDRLVEAIRNHPDLASVQHIELYCRTELVPFYQRQGFALVPPDLKLMRRER